MIRILTVLVVLAGILGTVAFLHISSYPDRYVKRSVAPAEIVGRWQVTPTSLRKACEYLRAYPDPRIPDNLQEFECRADGTVAAITFEPSGTSLTGGRPVSLTGTWKIGTNRGFKGHKTASEPCVELELQSGPLEFRSDSLFINEEAGALVLWAGVGDPDDAQCVAWKKASNASTATAPVR